MRELLEAHLEKRELIELLTLSHATLSCRERESLKNLINGLENLIYFEKATCAYTNIHQMVFQPDPEIDALNVSYPQEYLDIYLKNNLHLTDSVLIEVASKHKPVNWSEIDKLAGTQDPATALAYEFNMRDGWAHGVTYPDDLDCSYFFFGGSYAENNIRTQLILDYLVPFLADAYKRVLKRARKPEHVLTPREVEILKWIKEGKSSWDISVILNCSKRTVEFHVTNIKKKLKSVSRAQAVATGLQHGIIEF